MSREKKVLLGWLSLKAVLLLFLGSYWVIGLSPDEAQYWTWSQHLDWGYYSKPPGIAWQIWLTTSLLGDTLFGVRAGALVVGFALPCVIYKLARRVDLSEKQAFWSALALAFSPLGVYLSLVATTDGGAIVFLALAVAFAPRFWLSGSFIFLGALFKWTAFVFWPLAALSLFFMPSHRRWSLLGGMCLSLLALLPSLYWNIGHEWATFKHVGGAVSGGASGNFFDFLGAQVALLSPIFFALLILSFFYLKRRELMFCAAFPAAALIYLIASWFTKMQPNWAAYLYPPGMVLIGWFAYPRQRVWLHVGIWVAVAMSAGAFLAASWPGVPYKLNPFRHERGWEELTPLLREVGYNPESDFLFGDKYQVASILSFYGPGQHRAYFLNVSGSRKNQFSYWSEPEKGQTGYFVVLERSSDTSWYRSHYEERLAPYFERIDFIGAYPLMGGEKWAYLFECVDYLGNAPKDPEKY